MRREKAVRSGRQRVGRPDGTDEPDLIGRRGVFEAPTGSGGVPGQRPGPVAGRPGKRSTAGPAAAGGSEAVTEAVADGRERTGRVEAVETLCAESWRR